MKTKHVLYIFSGLLTAWFFAFCKNTGQGSGSDANFRNVRDSVAYVGMATCASCHAGVHETFAQTGMGQSFGAATPQKSAASYGPHAVVYDTIRNLYYYPFFKDSTMYVLEYRLEKGDTVHTRLEKINYIVGSGQHTNSHIVSVNGYAYQAPVTWYSQQKRWDLAPGFRENNSRFDRFLTDECITCHNHYPTLVPGSLNKYAAMPTGIECERCHGPGKLHVAEKLQGIVVDTSKEADYSIVNPRRLSRDLQMDLCQRCHLQGVAVLNEGKTFFDFKPGMALNEVFNVFLPRFTNSHDQFIMASQADRLRLSECFKNAPDLSCITCHQPHRSVAVTPVSQYNNACQKCHAPPKLACTAPEADRQQNGDNCSACHMPKSGSIDIPHVSITDHKIAKPAKPATVAAAEKPAFLGIQILTKPNPSPLDMAKGYLATHDKYLANSVMLDSAWFYLQKDRTDVGAKLPTLVHYHFLRQDFDAVLQAAASQVKPSQPLDAWTAYRIGEAFFQKGDYPTALRYLDMATAALPFHLDFLEKKGAVLVALKRYDLAKEVLAKVVAENPKRPVALCNLGYAYAMKGDLLAAERLYDEALALDPDYEQALVNKAALLIFQQKKPAARVLLGRVLRINPLNRQAIEGLKRLEANYNGS